MKKLFTLLIGLLLFASPLLTGCDNGDETVEISEGRLVQEVVIPTALPVFKTMELSIKGSGFLTGDMVALRTDHDEQMPTTVLSDKEILVEIPSDVVDQKLYKFVLFRGDDYQVLGASRLKVQLVVDALLPETTLVLRGTPLAIIGYGFQPTDKLFVAQGEGKFEATLSTTTSRKLTYDLPAEVTPGAIQLILQRGGDEQKLGETTLQYPVADQAGATIKGNVFCGSLGVADVLVSDGDLFTKTDANGQYWLPSTKRNALVFVVQPSGYEVITKEAMPIFWQPCTLNNKTVEQVDFQLIASDNDKHTMLVATDMHLAKRNTPVDHQQFADGFVKEVTTAYNGSSEKVYCLNLGDFSWDLYWYSNSWAIPECKGAIKTLKFPFWSAMGNHDNDPYVANDYKAEAPYRRHLGPVYYSMNIGQVHYIMLDNTEYTNAGGAPNTIGDREYNRRVVPEVLEWLKKDLSFVDKNTPIVLGLHCPIYSYSSTGSVTVAMQNQAAVNDLLNCFTGFKSVNVVTGHTHVNRSIQSPTAANVYEHNVAAVSGTWWWTQQYASNNVCTDGSPAGYKVFSANGTDLKWHYKSVGLAKERQFMSYDMNSVKTYWTTNETALQAFASGNLPGRSNDYADVGENVVYLNVWSYEPTWTIKVTENGTELPVSKVWKYDPLHTASYDIPRGVTSSLTFPSTACMHMFSVKASSANSTLNISVADRFGNNYTETMTRPKSFTTSLTH